MERKTFLARQPIMDRHGTVVAQQLLFRPESGDAAAAGDGLACTAAVIERALAVFGIDAMLGSADAYLKCTADFLYSNLADVLPAQRFVLEILDHEAWHPLLAARCDALRAQGFRIALDGVGEVGETLEAGLAHVDVIKLDWQQLDAGRIPALLSRIHATGRQALAQHVERREQHGLAIAAGCDLFQGHYFSQPQLFAAASVPPNIAPVLKVLKMLADDATETELERELRHAPELVVNLLHLADCNDREHARDMRISSVGQALRAVGRRRLMRWCCILLYGMQEEAQADRDPLVQMVERRAAFIEMAAKDLMPDRADIHQAAYLTGILSLLHIPHGLDSASFIARLPVSDLVGQAIVSRAGALGALLSIAESLEVGHYQTALEQGRDLGAGFQQALTALAHWGGIAPSFELGLPVTQH